MFMVEEFVQIPLGRHPEGRKHLLGIFEAMREQPGFRTGQIAQYLGNIRQHMTISYWEDRQAYEDWANGPKATELASVRPPYTVGPEVGRYWEMFLETTGDRQGNYLNQGILQVNDATKWDEFYAQRLRHDASAKAAGGLVYVQAFKYVGEPIEPFFTPLTAAILVRRVDRAAYEHSVELSFAAEQGKVQPYRSVVAQLDAVAGLHEIIHDSYPPKRSV